MRNLEWLWTVIVVVLAVVGWVEKWNKKRAANAKKNAPKGSGVGAKGFGTAGNIGNFGGFGTAVAGHGADSKTVSAERQGGAFKELLRELVTGLDDDADSMPSPVFEPKKFKQWFDDQYNTSDNGPTPTLQPVYVESLEDLDAERRYMGGEYGGMLGERSGGMSGGAFGGTLGSTKTVAKSAAKQEMKSVAKPAAELAANSENMQSADIVADDSRDRLREILGGEFDLRRAVIESEILIPRYA